MSPLPPAPRNATALKVCTCGAMLFVTPDLTEASYPCSICGAPIVVNESATLAEGSPPE